MNITMFKSQLQMLRLFGAYQEVDDVVDNHKRAIDLKWATELFQREIDYRKQKSQSLKIKQAGFPEITSLEKFDWSFNPEIDRSKIEELAELHFIEDNRIALFLGAPGTGKSHLAIAIGYRAACSGHRVYWTSLKRLSQEITLARAKNSMDVLFKKVLSAKLWIIDDWGVVTLKRDVAEEVFDLLDRRKTSSAMILTSNRDINEWGEVFPDPIIANATIDRIFDRAKVVLFKGDSYRLKGKIKTKEIDLNKSSQ